MTATAPWTSRRPLGHTRSLAGTERSSTWRYTNWACAFFDTRPTKRRSDCGAVEIDGSVPIEERPITKDEWSAISQSVGQPPYEDKAAAMQRTNPNASIPLCSNQ